MKKNISLILVLILSLTIIAPFAYADGFGIGISKDKFLSDFNNPDNTKLIIDRDLNNKTTTAAIENIFAEFNDDEVIAILYLSMLENARRKTFSRKAVANAIDAIVESDGTRRSTVATSNEYTFGQGTYEVGPDLKPGTYDVTCLSVENEDIGSIYSSFGDLGDEYSDYYHGLGGLMDSITYMTLETIKANGYTDRYLTLKKGQTARVILQKGMLVEITDGSAKFTFIR